MKKSRILGYALTLAATLVVGGAMGQTDPTAIKTDYTKIDADAVSANNSFVTAGKKVDFYVLPDLAFHVGYNATDNSGLIPGTTWKWTIGTGVAATSPALTAGVGPAATAAGAQTANYVELTAGNAATVAKITVQEQAPSLCIDGTGKDFYVHVFPKPTVSFDQSKAISIANATCTAADKPVVLNINAAGSINAKWTLQVYEANVTSATTYGAEAQVGGDIAFSFTKDGGVTQTLNGKSWTLARTSAADYTVGTWNAIPASIVNPANGTFTLSGTYPLTYQGGKDITIYRFKFSATDGIDDFISRKSDHGGSATLYTGASDQVVELIVKRAPKTGPIYHIANNKYN